MSREQNIIPIFKNELITHQGLLYGKKQCCSGGNLYANASF